MRIRPRLADRFVLGIGLACVWADCSRRVKVAGVELPVITSLPRQLLLGTVGLLLVAASLVVRTREGDIKRHPAAGGGPTGGARARGVPPATRLLHRPSAAP